MEEENLIEDDDKFIISEEEMERRKKFLAKSLFSDAQTHLQYIKRRNEKENNLKIEKINFIQKKCGNKYGDEDYLMDLSVEEVNDIHNEIINHKKNLLKRIFQIFK